MPRGPGLVLGRLRDGQPDHGFVVAILLGALAERIVQVRPPLRRADLREPEQVLGDPQVRGLLDFSQPIGLMFMCVLHCLWDKEDPWAVVRQFRDAVIPGSYLALSHMTDEAHPEAAEGLFRISQDLHWNTPLISRSRADIARFFDGFTLVEPGLVRPAQWRPDLDDPLRKRAEPDGGDETVIRLPVPEPPEDDRGVAWHLCGIGIKDQP